MALLGAAAGHRHWLQESGGGGDGDGDGQGDGALAAVAGSVYSYIYTKFNLIIILFQESKIDVCMCISIDRQHTDFVTVKRTSVIYILLIINQSENYNIVLPIYHTGSHNYT